VGEHAVRGCQCQVAIALLITHCSQGCSITQAGVCCHIHIRNTKDCAIGKFTYVHNKGFATTFSDIASKQAKTTAERVGRWGGGVEVGD